MKCIVEEVELIEKSSKLITDKDHQELFQSPVIRTRLPVVEASMMVQIPTGKKEKEELDTQEEPTNVPALYSISDNLTFDETAALDKLKEDYLGIGKYLRMSSAVGAAKKGVPFPKWDFLQSDWEIKSVKVEVAQGAISGIEVEYKNDLISRHGEFPGGLVKELTLSPGERIICASLEHGQLPSQGGTRILAIRLFTNHGRRLLGQAAVNEVARDGVVTKDGVLYEKVENIYIDSPFHKGTLRGFFGRCDESDYHGIIRVGLIWGDLSEVVYMDDKSKTSFDYEDANNEAQALRKDLAEKNRLLQDALNGKKPITIAQGGITGSSSQWKFEADLLDQNIVKFDTPYRSAPRMISGLTHLDQNLKEAIRLEMRHQNVTPTGFETITRTFGGTRSYGGLMSWMALPDNDIHIETGVMNSYDMYRIDDDQAILNRMTFPRRFGRAPTVVTWIYEVSMPTGWHSICTGVRAINEEEFDLCIKTWAQRKFDSIRIGWLAFNDTGCNSRMKVGYIRVDRKEKWKCGKITFDGIPFTKSPAVFIALMEFSAGDNVNLRLSGKATDINMAGFSFGCGSWAQNNDSNMNHSQWVWIAAE